MLASSPAYLHRLPTLPLAHPKAGCADALPFPATGVNTATAGSAAENSAGTGVGPCIGVNVMISTA